MAHYLRPSSLTGEQVREPIDGECSNCQTADIRRYPVTSEGG